MLKYKGYTATYKFSESDNSYVGYVINIQDSLNFSGETVEELELMFHQSIDDYLEMCKHFKKEANKCLSQTK